MDRIRLPLLTLFAAAAALLGSCKSAGSGGERLSLVGPQWELLAFEGQDDPAAVRAPRPYLEFFDHPADPVGRAKSFSGSGGCNRLFGNWTPGHGTELALDSIGATRMACEEDVMAAERRFLELLPLVVSYEIEGRRLRLVHPRGSLLLAAR